MSDDKEGDELVRQMDELDRKRAAEPPPELTNDVVVNLAGMTPLQYAQKLGAEAKKHRVPMRLLEKAVEAARVEIEVEKLLEPHWEVKPADDPVDAAQLFAEIEARILRHVVMSKDFAFVAALWIGQTWIHEHATYSPILAITSAERDSGKSTLMGIIRFLVRRSLLSVGISAAALYRSIEKWSPTFVLDECDELFADNPDLLRVVNSGWTRGQGVVRCDPETNEPTVFSTFCPKAIAGKGKKMPDTMTSRTIFIEMKRRLKGEKIDHFRHLDDPGFQRMRSQLTRWAQDCGETLGAALPSQPEGFINRTASNWTLLFAIADSLGKEAGARARGVAQQIAGVTEMTSAGVMLLQDIKAMFDSSTLGRDMPEGPYLPTKLIIERLTADPEKPWAEWGKRGKPITDKGIADLLKEYRIVSQTVGPRDARSKGYRRADFEDAWGRYLTPDAEKKEGEKEGGQNPDTLPFTRSPHCNDCGKDENSAVHRTTGEREKIGRSSNEINAVNVRTAKMVNPEPLLSSPSRSADDAPLGRDSHGYLVLRGTDVPDIPAGLLRCFYCNKPGAEPWDLNGRTINLHPGCQQVWVEEQERTINTRM